MKSDLTTIKNIKRIDNLLNETKTFTQRLSSTYHRRKNKSMLNGGKIKQALLKLPQTELEKNIDANKSQNWQASGEYDFSQKNDAKIFSLHLWGEPESKREFTGTQVKGVLTNRYTGHPTARTRFSQCIQKMQEQDGVSSILEREIQSQYDKIMSRRYPRRWNKSMINQYEESGRKSSLTKRNSDYNEEPVSKVEVKLKSPFKVPEIKDTSASQIKVPDIQSPLSNYEPQSARKSTLLDTSLYYGMARMDHRQKQRVNLEIQEMIKQVEQRIKQRKAQIKEEKNKRETLISQLIQEKRKMVEITKQEESLLNENRHSQFSFNKEKQYQNDSKQAQSNTGRVSSMYKNYYQNDILKEKDLMTNVIKKVKDQSSHKTKVLFQLQQENQKLQANVKRWQQLLEKTKIQNQRGQKRGDFELQSLVSFSQVPSAFETQSQNLFGSRKGSKSNLINKFVNYQFDGKQQTYVDIIKIEKFTTFVTTTLTYKHIVDFILHFLDGIKLVFKCHRVSLFMVDERAEELMMGKIEEDKMKYIGQYEHFDQVLGEKRTVKIITRAQNRCQKILIGSLSQPNKESVRKVDKMAVIIRNHKNQIAFVIQIEFNPNQNTINQGSPSKNEDRSRSSSPSKKHQIYSISDENTLKIMGLFIYERIHEMKGLRKADIRSEDMLKTIDIASRMGRQQTFQSLMKAIQSEIKLYFDFQHCGVLFYDRVKKSLYTLSLDQDKPTSDTPQQPTEPTFQSDLMITSKEVVWFPCELGLTGKCFNKGQIQVIHDFSNTSQYGPRQQFQNDIDNILNVKPITNYLIAPMQTLHRLSYGVIQLFNQNQGKVKKKYIGRMRAFSFLLGELLSHIAQINNNEVIMISLQFQQDNMEKQRKNILEIEENYNLRQAMFNQIEVAKKNIEAKALEFMEIKEMTGVMDEAEETARKWQQVLKKKLDGEV